MVNLIKKRIPLQVFIGMLFAITCGIHQMVFSQDFEHGFENKKNLSALMHYAANQYGSDDRIANGKAYIPDHYNAKGNPCFLSDLWLPASLIIDGKKFENQEILYNIDLDEVILKTTINHGNNIMLVVNSESLDAFHLESHHFINAAQLNLEEMKTGFVEDIYSGSFRVVIRHHKSFVGAYTNTNPNGFYTKNTSTIYLISKGQTIRLPSKRALFAFFATRKSEIRNFIHKNNINYKKATPAQLNKLFTYCDEPSIK